MSRRENSAVADAVRKFVRPREKAWLRERRAGLTIALEETRMENGSVRFLDLAGRSDGRVPNVPAGDQCRLQKPTPYE